MVGLSDSLMRVDELFETRAYKQYSQVFLDVVVISPADLRKALGIASIAGAEKANRRRMDPELRAMTEQDRFEAVMFARGCGMLCRNLQDGYVHSSDQLMWATWKAAVETERAR